MTSINSTPAEIQQKILRYVISVPIVLDPDALASTDILAMSEYHVSSPQSQWNNLKPYWATERDRNSCRRVCASWNIYLKENIGHRYVGMVDIAHGNLPASALRDAIRVSFFFHWRCAMCEGKTGRGFAPLLRDALTGIVVTRTQIVTTVGSKCLATLADHMPNIVTIVNLSGGEGVGRSITQFKQLRYLHVGTGDIFSENHVLDAPNLQTLSFTPRLLMTTNFVQPGWNLRSLHTLRVVPGILDLARVHTERVIGPLLRAVGPNLKNLFLPYAYLVFITAEIWQICPNLETITAMKSGSLIEGLPSTHPLRTVIIPCYGQEAPLVDVPTSRVLPESSLIRIVIVDCPWGYRFPENLIRSWAHYWMRYSIRIEDIHGVSAQDWIARLDQRKISSVNL